MRYVFELGLSEKEPFDDIRITIEAEVWDNPPNSVSFICLDFERNIFSDWAETAMNLHGYFIDPDRPTARDLYEALSKSWPHKWRLKEGELPKDPFPNPDADMEPDIEIAE